jgi:hypothetical protein
LSNIVDDFLLSPAGCSLINSVAKFAVGKMDPNSALGKLRKECDPETARRAWDMALLRQRAGAKFGGDSSLMYFTREALEMASGLGPASYHARCISETGCRHVIDLCSGIGGDAVAFAKAGLSVTMVDSNPQHILYALANVRAHGCAEHVEAVCGDAGSQELLDNLAEKHPHAAVWFDPARRTLTSKRTVRPEDYMPSLSLLARLRALNFKSIGVKLAPAIDHDVAAEYGAELEFLSHEGECKEALLWLGCADRDRPHTSAVLLKRGTTYRLEDIAYSPIGDAAPVTAPDEGKFLYEPDPAVIRSHLVRRLAQILSARLIDPQIAYLLGGQPVLTPYAECYPIIEHFEYSRRALQGVVDRHNIGRLIVKKRGVPIEPEDVIRQVKFRSGDELIVVITRKGDTRIAYLCHKPLISESDPGLEA